MQFISKISSENLKQYNELGWIPGPKEDEEQFLKRIEKLKHLVSYPPEDIDLFLTDGDWQKPLERMEDLYNCAPDWIVSYYSNKNLSFIQGAATWIQEEEGMHIPIIQVRKQLAEGKLLGLYSLEEILTHEAVHAVRMEFDEPLFEEILAYRTSNNLLRRYFGPLFLAHWEAPLFLATLCIPLGIEIAKFYIYDIGVWGYLQLIPVILFVLALLRLLFLQTCLMLALRKIPLAMALRLTDQEIFQFAFNSHEKIEEMLREQKSVRWRLLKEIYVKKLKI